MAKLKNGAFVIEAHHSALTGKNTVLAEWQGHHHPFVTWRLDQDGNSFLGHYFATLEEATEDFNERIR